MSYKAMEIAMEVRAKLMENIGGLGGKPLAFGCSNPEDLP